MRRRNGGHALRNSELSRRRTRSQSQRSGHTVEICRIHAYVVETPVDELAMRAKVDPMAQAGCQKTPSAHFAADPTKSCIEFADPFSQIRN